MTEKWLKEKVNYREDGRFTVPKDWDYDKDQKELMKLVLAEARP